MARAVLVTSVEKPERPMVPGVLWALAVALGVCQVVLWEGDVRGTVVVSLLVAIMGFAGWWIGRRLGRWNEWKRVVLLSCVVGMVAICSTGLELVRGTRLAEVLAEGGLQGWEFEVVADAAETQYGWRCRAQARRAAGASDDVRLGGGPSDVWDVLADWVAPPVGDVWLSLGEPAGYGEVLRVVGSFEENGDDDWGVTSRRQGVWGQVRVRSVRERRQVAGVRGLAVGMRERALGLIDAGSSEGRALLAGCVCGRRVELKACGLDDLFSTCGVAHLLAVSGGHIAVVATLIGATLLRLGAGPVARGSATAVVSGLFVLCCGAPASAVRSWLMALAGVGATVAGRRDHSLSTVCLVACAMALADPGVTGQLGYLLSVASVLGLALFSGYAAYAAKVLAPTNVRWLPLPRRARWAVAWCLGSARASLALSLVCQLATLGLVVAAFGRVALLGPVANLLTGTLFTPLVAVGSVAAALASVPGAGGACRLLLGAGDLLARVMVGCLRMLARLPLASVEVGESWGVVLGAVVVAVAAVLVVRWPDVRRGPVLVCAGVAALVVGVLLVRWRWLAPARIVVLDVGQGDAILVQDGGAAVLVDAGPQGAVAEALAREHVLHLDAVVLTHLHADHYGGVADLASAVGACEVLVGEGAAAGVSGELAAAVERVDDDGVDELGYGDELRVGGWVLRVVWPREPRDGDENADSLMLAVSYAAGGRTLEALLTGDAERDETAAVLAAGDVGDIDLLKVGHHGSAVSLTLAEAAALDAEVAVASAGEGNSYGHPTAECMEVLEAAGSRFLCTIDVGDVCVEPGAAGPVVRVQRGGDAMG